jgi:hypothetical protein
MQPGGRGLHLQQAADTIVQAIRKSVGLEQVAMAIADSSIAMTMTMTVTVA